MQTLGDRSWSLGFCLPYGRHELKCQLQFNPNHILAAAGTRRVTQQLEALSLSTLALLFYLIILSLCLSNSFLKKTHTYTDMHICTRPWAQQRFIQQPQIIPRDCFLQLLLTAFAKTVFQAILPPSAWILKPHKLPWSSSPPFICLYGWISMVDIICILFIGGGPLMVVARLRDHCLYIHHCEEFSTFPDM